MIKIILGGVGSGKSLLATKNALERKHKLFANYHLRLKNFTRLKVSHVIKADKKQYTVNWQFWTDTIKKHGGFDIIIDEIHNLMHARRSMSRQNVTLSQWVSQVRKVTGDNELYDLVCISQVFERIDVSVRDLAHEIVICQKVEFPQKILTTIYKNNKNNKKQQKMLPVTLIFLKYFIGDNCKERYLLWRSSNNNKLISRQSFFIANPFFKFYDSYEVLSFGETEYL